MKNLSFRQQPDPAHTPSAGDHAPSGSAEDEISQLATAVNEMADSLQQSQENLAQLVAERTAALEQAEARLKGIVESAPDAIISVDAEQHVIMFNEAAEEIFGWASSEAMGQHISTFIPEHSRHAHEGYVRTFAQSPERSRARIVNRAMFARRRNGEEFPVEASISKVDIGGQLILTVIIRDITERKKMEQALQERNRELKESQEYSRNVIDSSLDMIITVDLERRIVAFNKAAQDTFGYSQEEIVGKSIDVLYANPREGRVVHDTTVEKGSFRQEVLNRRKDGRTFPAFISASVLRNTKGELTGVMGVSRDITEQKQAEQQIREALAEKEMLLREVNHRVGNNLTAIAGMLALVRQELRKSDSTAHQATIDALDAQVVSLSTVHNMLSASAWRPLELDDLARQIIQAALRSLSPDKDVSVSVSPSPLKVTSDQAHNLALSINELVTNTTKHALQDGGKIHISVDITQDDDDIVFVFRDDGTGYPEDVLHLKRHGVGLDLLRQIAGRNLRGDVTFHNDGGAVTVMRFKREA